MGKGQIRAADYVMTPNRISQNHNAGGSAIAGMLGGLVGGNAGNLVGGLNLSKLTADVVLTITDVRSSEQVAMAEGNAKKTDLAGARVATSSAAATTARPVLGVTPIPRSAR